MLAKELLSNDIPAILETDTVSHALEIMNKYKIAHLPVITDQNQYLGLFEDLNDSTHDLKNKISQIILLPSSTTKIHEYQHFFAVFEIIKTEKITIVPVVTDKNEYLGNITQKNIIENIALLLSLQSHGGIIIIEVYFRDYSLSQIAQIIESNGAKILNLCTSASATMDYFDITIRVNTSEITSIIETLLRYNYVVKSFFGEYNKLEDLYQSRIDEFLKFMSI